MIDGDWQHTWGMRAKNADGFRYMPRMVDTTGDTILEVHGPNDVTTSETTYDGTHAHVRDDGYYYLPDLTDPATLGCLEALCRERHGEWFKLDRYVSLGGMCSWASDLNTGLSARGEHWRAECMVLALEAEA